MTTPTVLSDVSPPAVSEHQREPTSGNEWLTTALSILPYPLPSTVAAAVQIRQPSKQRAHSGRECRYARQVLSFPRRGCATAPTRRQEARLGQPEPHTPGLVPEWHPGTRGGSTDQSRSVTNGCTAVRP